MGIEYAIGACSDVGCKRTGNEDSVGYGGWTWRTTRAAPLMFAGYTDEPMAFVVADGLGGHNAGEVASAMVAEMLSWPLGTVDHDGLSQRLALANSDLAAVSETDPRLAGMGSTVVGLYLDARGVIHLVNVGDSRSYRLTEGTLRQVSEDDRAAIGVGGSMVLTQCLGGNHPAPADPHLVTFADDVPSRFLLCSDGLWSCVDDHRIEDILCTQIPPQDAAGALIAEALAAGAPDNVTALIVDLTKVA